MRGSISNSGGGRRSRMRARSWRARRRGRSSGGRVGIWFLTVVEVWRWEVEVETDLWDGFCVWTDLSKALGEVILVSPLVLMRKCDREKGA